MFILTFLEYVKETCFTTPFQKFDQHLMKDITRWLGRVTESFELHSFEFELYVVTDLFRYVVGHITLHQDKYEFVQDSVDVLVGELLLRNLLDKTVQTRFELLKHDLSYPCA